MKKISLILVALFYLQVNFAQVIFSNSAGNLTLQNFVVGPTQYTTVPTLFSTIQDGHNNNVGFVGNPNKPFNVPALKNTGWAVVYNATENDTFFVSTSWFDTTTIAANRWLITPQITGIVPNTVLTWYAKSPDPSNADAYEVYGTNKIGTLTSADFTIGDRLFAIANYSTTTGGENSTWTKRSINLTPFAGQNLRFAFKNYSTNKYQLWIDDIQVVTLANSLDLGLSALKTNKYVLINTQNTIGLSYTNNGASAINTITLNYKIGSSTVQTETLALANPLNYNETNTFTFGLPYSVSGAGLYPLKCWVSNVNGTADQSQINDTLITNITIQATTPKKRVLVEQYVSAYDGESCDAQSKLIALKNDTTIIAVNIHDLDSLKEVSSTAVINAYKKYSSTALVDRQYFDSSATVAITRSYYANKINSRLNAVTPVSINIINKTYNSLIRELVFTLQANFVGEVKGDYRFNAYLTENNVSGNNADTTVNGFNQLNNYYTIPWSAYYNTGYFSSTSNAYVLNTWQYKHQNTLVRSVDGSFGFSGGPIPLTGGTQGQSYQKTYTITIATPTPGISKYNEDNMYIVGFVAEYSTNKNERTVLNVTQTKITTNPEIIGVKEIISDKNQIKIYPNPSTGIVFIETAQQIGNYELKVFDVLGNCVFIQNSYNTVAPKSIDLTGLKNGVYFLSINSNLKTINTKLIIQK